MVQAVRLTVMPDAVQMPRGGWLSLSATVQNAGSTGDRYRLDVSGVPEDWYTLDTHCVSLAPGAREQLHLLLHPPAGTTTAAERYSLTVQVTSEDGLTIQASAVVALEVDGGGLSMDVSPAEAEGRQATFRVTFLNQF